MVLSNAITACVALLNPARKAKGTKLKYVHDPKKIPGKGIHAQKREISPMLLRNYTYTYRPKSGFGMLPTDVYQKARRIKYGLPGG